ncbi:MAG: VOC family protein [Sinorhizobium meliloti]|jgi:catechol 2,3-dioxygenase-like lactoylglutathione lyase family enzyme|uniref:VOC family protein n=1 Tax=Sinorhizobium TaxID=28105 RepID=UPI0003765052|nr:MULTISPECIES: VOC family protein [Sinorhizobium]MCG5482342.1 VOC family protein [Sinorhizobium meliloti]PND23471.1 glyoxalase [Ensifer sp. MMN_5]PND28784.1 glyoxalase [Sinorhizobium sp. M4_45]RVP99056.1 glyoxalase [Sinorhizobium meliloti]
MTVRRIVPNLQVSDPLQAQRFYADLLGLEVVMDHGWIVTFAAVGRSAMPQVSFATEGGSGTPVPALSIEVDDVDETYHRATAAGAEIVYDITDESWGVRRFFLRDPFGTIVNVLSHRARA